jgi:hypothetical protein
LVRTQRLDWQERKAESFILTPLYCGSTDTGYRPTSGNDLRGEEGYGGNLSLGTAVTISGAAASPNMGNHSSPAVTALLTVFNARLGAWLGNPQRENRWRARGPDGGLYHLFLELIGWTDATDKYVYLSDGGHFANLGAYELIRRRCRYVIVVDADQDEGHLFAELSNLIHKCRVDFGIGIEIDLGSLHPSAEGRCRWHCAVGRIFYDDADPYAVPGTLVYVKPSLTGDEPADVLSYRELHPTFPHDPTAEQFFNESQFESYRALGEHIANAVFKESADVMKQEETRAQQEHGRFDRALALFSSLERRWFALPPAFEESFVSSTEGFIKIQEALRKDGQLWRLSLDLYPELDPDGERRGAPAEAPEQFMARRCAEVHVIAQMLQVMENAWLSLNLDVNYVHPLNRGWMDVFYRWTRAETVREHWPLLRSEFARGFVSFCEKQMGLREFEGAAVEIQKGQPPPALLERLCHELQCEWPKAWDWETVVKRPLEHLLTGVNGSPGESLPRGWLVCPTPYPPDGPPVPGPPCLPAGLVLVTRRDATDALDLFVWIRGAYRNSGLGRSAVRRVLKDFEGKRLRVRLPVVDAAGPGAKVQQDMWLTFFYHHGFAAEEGRPEGTELVLVWNWPPSA